MKISGFCDLNVSIPGNKFLQKTVDEYVKLGYKTIAINTIVGESPDATSKKKKGQSKEFIPPPQCISNIEAGNKNLQILQRVTAYFTDANQLQRICKSENARKYNIIAVIPKSTNAFQLACACKDIDLISFDASEQPVRMNRKLYNLAVANSLFFEIPYAPAISDSGKRRTTIQIAHNFHTYGKSKNIVLTSGVTDIIRVRGPYDIANLGLLLGLSEEQAKYSMLNTSRALLLRAEGRRYGKTAMTMMITDLQLASGEESDEEPAAKRSKTATDSDTDSEMSS